MTEGGLRFVLNSCFFVAAFVFGGIWTAWWSDSQAPPLAISVWVDSERPLYSAEIRSSTTFHTKQLCGKATTGTFGEGYSFSLVVECPTEEDEP